MDFLDNISSRSVNQTHRGSSAGGQNSPQPPLSDPLAWNSAMIIPLCSELRVRGFIAGIQYLREKPEQIHRLLCQKSIKGSSEVVHFWGFSAWLCVRCEIFLCCHPQGLMCICETLPACRLKAKKHPDPSMCVCGQSCKNSEDLCGIPYYIEMLLKSW